MNLVNSCLQNGKKPVLEVSGCFIVSDNRCLFLKRHPDKPYGHTWCLPAGKLDQGEKPNLAACREVKEETGIDIPIEELSYIDTFVNLNQIDEYIFHVYCWKTNLEPKVVLPKDELVDFCWFTREKLVEANLIPGGFELIEILAGRSSTLPQELSFFLTAHR